MATSNITNLTNIKELSDGAAGGTRLGKTASELVSFHGVPPVDQAAVITLETTVSASVIASRVKSIIAALVEKGIIASA
jgi:hypothetical protein